MIHSTSIENDAVTSFAMKVVNKEIPSGALLHASCKRHIADLENARCGASGWMWSASRAARVIRFFTFLRHFKGEWAGDPIQLQPFQQFIVGSLFGWIDPDTGLRRFRQCYLEQPRGQGKSTVAAGVALWLAFFDREPGAEVYTAATHRAQAKITWEAARQMVLRSSLKQSISVRVSNLHQMSTASKLEPLGADVNGLDGLRPSGVILDEIHAYRSSGLIDVMSTATGTRRQPLIFEITTAGVGRLGPCWDHHDYTDKVVRGVVQDDTWFGCIIGADPEDDWRDPSVWAKANPNLGVSVKLDDLDRKCKQAQHIGAAEPEFRRLHLGQWVQQAERYLPMDKWDLPNNAAAIDWRALEGQPCVIGLDVSSKFDFTAAVAVFTRPDGSVAVWPMFFLPEAVVESGRRSLVPLEAWRRAGYLTVTPGNVVDQTVILQTVLAFGQRYRIQEIAFDAWNATELALRFQSEGLKVVEVRQGFKTLSEPTQTLAALVSDGKLQHAAHPVLRWMADNLVVRTDPNANLAPDKAKASEKIDGMVALIMALSRRGRTPSEQYQMLVLGSRR